jgi:hypothetical protein
MKIHPAAKEVVVSLERKANIQSGVVHASENILMAWHSCLAERWSGKVKNQGS